MRAARTVSGSQSRRARIRAKVLDGWASTFVTHPRRDHGWSGWKHDRRQKHHLMVVLHAGSSGASLVVDVCPVRLFEGDPGVVRDATTVQVDDLGEPVEAWGSQVALEVGDEVLRERP